MFEFVVDDRVVLKLLDTIHADQLFELSHSDRTYLKEWLPWVDGTMSVEDTRSFIEMTKNQFVSNNGFQAGIWYKGNIAGVIGFHGINGANRSTSIGYWLGEMYQGTGVMTKCCSAFINYAFKELKLNRVEIRCAEKNFKSRAIPERLGFIQEGLIRDAEWLYDHYVDHVVYGTLAKEWIARQGKDVTF
ncbi:MAG TPA: GNAT family protein [Desulfosporosinus sp.]